MSVREYIGARYIPLFSDPLEWDSSLSYEPLTVVKNQGSSYVSRQYVPEGVAITNEDYWILWADFNAQLEQYRAEVQQFDGRITANADAIADEAEARAAADTTLAGDIAAEKLAREAADTALSGDISAETLARQAKDTELEDDIRAIETAIATSTVKNECVLMLGDSYAQGEHSESATSHNGPNWQDYLTNVLGFTDTYKYKAGSAGFVATSTSTEGSSSTVPTGTTYNEILNYAYDYINGLGRADEVKHILIQGGVNDASRLINGTTSESAIRTAVTTCAQNLRSKFPNAKIYIVYCSCGYTSWQKSLVRTKSIPTVYNMGAAYGGAVYGQCTNLPWIFSQSTVSHDGSHPTSDMQRYIAGYMARVLMGDTADYSATFSVRGGDYGANFVANVTSDHKLIYPLTGYINFSSAVPFNDGTTAQPTLTPADTRLEVSNSDFIEPCIYYNGNVSFIGQFAFRVSGATKWIQKDLSQTATTRDSITSLGCYIERTIG